MTARANPYVGLVPYTEAEAEWFFGREAEQRIITANLRASRLTLLYGASGVGKSSVLLAGVAPRLRAMVAENVAAGARRRGGHGPATLELPRFALTVFRNWRDPPLAPLADAIRASVVEASGDASIDRWEPGRSFTDTLRGWTTRARTLLVVLDQVEEYFLYHADEDGPGTFAGEFPRVVNDVDLRVNFLLSLREDAWTRLDRFKGHVPDLFSNYLRIDYLQRDAARTAIVRPIEEYNRRAGPGEPRASIDAELVEAVLDDVQAGRLRLADGHAAPGDVVSPSEGGDRVETPYLQLVMDRLWTATAGQDPRELTVRTLTGLGGSQAIVSSHLTDALQGLEKRDQEAAADIFRYLVTPSKTKIAHRATDLAYWSKRDEADVRRVLEALSTGEQRILRSVPPPPDEEAVDRYEIFHDVLAEAILEWRTRHEQEREKVAYAARMRAEARARKKARRDRILRRVAVGLTLAVVGLAAFMVYSLRERALQSQENSIVRSKGLAASAQAQLPVDPELSLLLSLEAIDENETRQAKDALVASLAESRVRATLGSGRPRPCRDLCRRRAPDGRRVASRGDALALSSDVAQRVSFSPDGATAAVVVRGEARLWHPESGDMRRIETGGTVTSATFVREGRALLTLGEDGDATLVSVDGGSRPRTLGQGVQSASMSRDGRFVAMTDSAGVVVRRLADGEEVRGLTTQDALGATFSPVDPDLLLVEELDRVVLWSWRDDRRRVLRFVQRGELFDDTMAQVPAAFSPDGRWVTTPGAGGRVSVWAVRTGTRRYTTAPDYEPVVQAVFSDDGARLLTATTRVATLRAGATGKPLTALAVQSSAVTAAAFSPGGAVVAAGGQDGAIRVIDARRGRQVLELHGHSKPIADLAFTPGGDFVLSVGEDGTARLWDVAVGDAVHRFGAAVSAMAVSRDAGRVVIAGGTGRSGSAVLWHPDAGRRRVLATGWQFEQAAVSPRATLAAVTGWPPGASRPVASLVDVETGRTRRLPVSDLADVAFTPDGKRLLTVGFGRPRLWDLRSWRSQPLGRTRYAFDVSSVAFSRDGGSVLLTTFGGVARVVDARTGATRRTFRLPARARGAPTPMSASDLSSDGKWVVTAAGSEALLWNTGSARSSPARRLGEHTGEVNAVGFSADGRWIVTGAEDLTTRVWSVRTGEQVAVLPHSSAVRHAAFTGRAHDIVTAEADGTVKLQACLPCTDVPALRRLARSRLTRGFTAEERLVYLEGAGA